MFDLRPLFVKLLLSVLACGIFWLDVQANDTRSKENGSVGVISSVNGEARLMRPTDPKEADQLKFRGPIIYGDSISTSKDSTVGLLVGQNSLLTMHELSEVRITESANNRRMLELAHGRVCVAMSTSGSEAQAPLTLKTPTTVVTAMPGTLLSVEVAGSPNESSRIRRNDERPIHVAMSTPSAQRGAIIETYHVIEGSIDIVSQASSAAPVHLRTGQSLRMTGGVMGRPFVGPVPNCRLQDVQIIPPHTTTPKAAQQTIVQDIRESAASTPLAAMTQASGGQGTGSTIPSGIIIPTTAFTLNPPPTTRTSISVRLP
jgi:hypothetical protein